MDTLSVVLYLVLLGLIVLATNRHYLRSYINSFKKFECKRCGRCCSFIVGLSDEDIRQIEKGTKYKKKDFVEQRKKKNVMKRINGYCIFLNISKGKAQCTIYNNRPKICKNFPFFKKWGLKMSDSRCYAFDKKFK
ncbi:YkgJ family cysteine cluster protein [Candidatus Woesearchaeota archaeon]|nr:YkgJ family cysteine cluster protein [Candidatus Woesearchaeota archaeon]MBW3014394.1 YkgJ family cysteine cluster protein [Candidatus Woesearchaeota archaeon]